jgi:tetratricopeptide (TPR) repeat protein
MIPRLLRRSSADPANLLRETERNLRKGNYGRAAAGLDFALRSASDTDVEPLLSEFVAAGRSAESEQSAAAVDAALTYRIAGLQVTLTALNSGASDTALDWAQKLVRRFPDDPGALTLQSLALEVQGKYDLALETCNRLIEIDKHDPEAFLRRAAVLVAIANEASPRTDNASTYQRALADYDRALELAPRLGEAYLARARVKVTLGDVPGAMSDFGQALQCDPQMLDAQFERGALREAGGHYESALQDYDAVAKKAPTVPYVHVARGRIHAACGELEEAVADFAQALHLHDGLAEAHVGRGGALLELGDFAGAQSDFDHALAVEPGNIGALQGRALAAINIGATLLGSNDYEAAQAQFERALDACDAVLAFEDDDALAHWHRGLALRGLDGHDWAADAFEQAVGLMPAAEKATIVRLRADFAEALRLWGETVNRKDKLERAVAEFAAVAEAADVDDLVWTLSSRAEALASLGKHEAAQALFDEALERDPGSAWAQIGRARLLYASGRPEAAVEELAKVAGSADFRTADLAWAHVTLALILEELGESRRAAKSYDVALHDRSDPVSYAERGAFAETFGSRTGFARAEADYRHALSLDASSVDALNSLAWLYTDKLATSEHLLEATDLAARAVTLAESDFARGFPLDTLGWAYHRLGRNNEAIEALAKAHETAPYRLVRRVHLEAARAAINT